MGPKSLNVILKGDWTTSIEPNIRWAGWIRASDEFATLVIASTLDRMYWAKAEIGTPYGLPMILDLHPLDGEGRSTQFIFIVGFGCIHQVVLLRRSADYQPSVFGLGDLPPGTVHTVFRADTEPIAAFSVLVLARGDVKVGRTGVWRLRTATKLDVPRTIEIALAGPRNGVVEISAV
jgi:hypothetical protein